MGGSVKIFCVWYSIDIGMMNTDIKFSEMVLKEIWLKSKQYINKISIQCKCKSPHIELKIPVLSCQIVKYPSDVNWEWFRKLINIYVNENKHHNVMVQAEYFPICTGYTIVQ